MSGKKEIEDGSIKKFCKKYNINYNLIMLKVTLFLMYGGKFFKYNTKINDYIALYLFLNSLATSSLIPYLTIHMQSIGLSVEEIAIVYLALPLTTFLAPPVSGIIKLNSLEK